MKPVIVREIYEDFQETVLKLETLAYNHSQINYEPRSEPVNLKASDKWVEEKMKSTLAEAYEKEFMVREGLETEGKDPGEDIPRLLTEYREENELMSELEEEFESAYNSVPASEHNHASVSSMQD